MDLKKLGHRIRTKREKRMLTQADIASVLDVSTQAVSKWERGENAPDISLLVRLSRLLDVSIEWLLGGHEAETDTFFATVLCTSLRGYAEKSARTPPADMASWVNSMYYSVTEAIMRNDGVPVKYVGDGSLGFFAGSNQSERALATAKLAKDLVGSDDLIIVLNYGEIYLGTIGHPDYARPDIIGETVNTAFLAMPYVAESCPSGVGITKAVRDNLADDKSLADRGMTQVLGIESPVYIYEPTS